MSRRGRLLFLQLQRQTSRRRLRNRKSSQRPQNRRKRRSHFQTLVQDTFHIGNVLTCRPSTPSSGHIWTGLLKRQLSEFEHFSPSKNIVDLGVRTPVSLTKARIVTALLSRLVHTKLVLHSSTFVLHSFFFTYLRIRSCADDIQQSPYSPFEYSYYAESISSLCSSSRGRVGVCPA